jgi:hypothetical protein
MAYAFIQDVPADEAMYREIRKRLGDETPDGLIAHVVLKREGGLRYVDVWESEAHWERFREERAEPTVDGILGELGIPHDHSLVSFEPVEVVDTWLGDRASV